MLINSNILTRLCGCYLGLIVRICHNTLFSVIGLIKCNIITRIMQKQMYLVIMFTVQANGKQIANILMSTLNIQLLCRSIDFPELAIFADLAP